MKFLPVEIQLAASSGSSLGGEMKLSQSWYPSQVPTEIIPQNLSPGFPNLVNGIHAITLAVNLNVTLDSS